MTRAFVILAVLAAALLVGAPKAECAYCPSYPCYAPCGVGCVCITPPGSTTGGHCYGVERAPYYVAKGWTVVR